RDLIGSYGDLARKFNDIRAQEDYRKFVGGSRALEQLLCHSIDWIMRKTGYDNAAVRLECDDTEFQLGAYIKYTVTGHESLIEGMRHGLVQQTTQHGQLLATGKQLRYRLSEAEVKYLSDQSILSTHCTYLGESLAVISLFRDE